MSQLRRLTLVPGKLVNRWAQVRVSSDNSAAFFGHFGPGEEYPSKMVFDPFDPSHGVSDMPEKFRGYPVDPNPGPYITMDYMPVPCMNYQEVYSNLQRKFNAMLALNAIFFFWTCYIGWFNYDILGYCYWSNPESYRNRKAINARLRAEEEAAAKEGMTAVE